MELLSTLSVENDTQWLEYNATYQQQICEGLHSIIQSTFEKREWTIYFSSRILTIHK